MPPLCTPEKIGAEDSNFDRINNIKKEGLDNQSNLYFTPQRNIKKRDVLDPDDAEIADILHKVPSVNKHFNICKIIGRGTFGTVFLANIKGDATRKKFALKHLIPTSHPRRIAFELKCMKNIGGINNVAGIQVALRHLGNVVFVMDYHHHEHFSSYIHLMDSKEIALYMKNLLIAIAHVHTFKIIHRDIKPSNFLYDRKNKTFLLIDFGLAQEIDELEGKDKANGNKRKREPLSPLNSILQPCKRAALHNGNKNSQNSKINLTSQQSVSKPKLTNKYSISMKENQPIHKVSIPQNATKAFDLSKSTYTQQNQQVFSVSTNPARAMKGVDKEKGKDGDDCHCYGKPKMCSKCTVRPALKASRAGTPGYRPPEVLFKYAEQTAAVDIWAAGIILLSILSNSINFFESPNDIVAIAELITIFGSDGMKKVAYICGRFLICDENKPKLDMRKICCILRNRPNSHLITASNCGKCNQTANLCICVGTPLHSSISDKFPDQTYHLLMKLLDANPNTRISAEEALKHPFLNAS